MKVLITGSTANQTNPQSHERSMNFAGMMRDHLVSRGISVVWQEPHYGMDVSEYDRILVGLNSPLALGSSKMYPTLWLINLLWEDSRLVLFLDSPDPNNITRALASIDRNPKSFTKDFFSNRRGFNEALNDMRIRSSIFSAMNKLSKEAWPKTLVPAFPWTEEKDIARELPSKAWDGSNLKLINLDLDIIDHPEVITAQSGIPLYRQDKWYYERGGNKSWIRKNKGQSPVFSLNNSHRESLRSYHLEALGSAQGLIHAPCRRELIWWTPKVALAVSQGTPVVTGKAATKFSPLWGISASGLELMKPATRASLALQQKSTYLNGLTKMNTQLLGVL